MTTSNDSEFLKEVLLSFRTIHNKTRVVLNSETAKKDITIVQLLLAHIVKDTPGISPNEATKAMFLGKSTISGLVSRMIDSGYLKKEQDPVDSRSYGLYLTDSGQKKVAETYDVYIQTLLPILSLPREELNQLILTHKKIIGIIDEVTAHD